MTARFGISRRRFVALSAASLSAFGGAVRGADLLSLRAASSSNDEVTPFLYALDGGLFRRAGIDAQIQRAPSGSAIVAGVVGGSFEVGKSSMPSLLAAIGKGVPITLLSPGGEYSAAAPSLALVVRPDGPIHSAADLNGKTAAVSAIDDLYTIAMRTWIDAHGGDSASVKMVEIPMNAVTETIAAGRLEAGTLTEPFLRAGLESGKVRLLGYSATAIAPRFTMTAWFARSDFAQKNPDLAARFVRVMREASAYANAHHSETVNMLARFMSVDPQDITAMGFRVNLGTSLDPRLLKPLIDAAARYKVMASAIDPRELISPVALR